MPVNLDDPRVKRTRELMLQSFMGLLEQKKNIYSISIQDITSYATVNRSTFYAHFQDKYAFLECWMSDKFRKIVELRLTDYTLTGTDDLRTLIQVTFEFLARLRQYMTPGDVQFEPIFEVAIQKEVERLLLRWLHEKVGEQASIAEGMIEPIAKVISWGIFGSAVQWSRNPKQRTVEAMTRDLLAVAITVLEPVN
ncbi:TetR/AcrR family transcriptional regulator [Paenibacillus xylanilyticus]|uniref:TetR family transcriptional regulator n=1 Tax=Paenibacillus xylanilyticus TaxID=248903 RepID=A0A7Y6C2J6_9BACL|nr:TetR family transcriptional regulator [Paenibacillus xylanilyticus]NUU79006.1 TetR family transcriptional regulator [Paenibacillus xylanilyticus]